MTRKAAGRYKVVRAVMVDKIRLETREVSMTMFRIIVKTLMTEERLQVVAGELALGRTSYVWTINVRSRSVDTLLPAPTLEYTNAESAVD